MKHFIHFLILFVPLSCLAKAVKLCTFPIPMMVESADKGVFVELTQEIAKRAGIHTQIEIAPAPRALKIFGDGEVEGLFPALDVTLPAKVHKSEIIYIKTDYIFSNKKYGFKAIKDLEGKKVGLTAGYPYDKKLLDTKSIQFEYASDDVTNMRKLGMGRIDAFVVEEKTGLKALERSGQKNITYFHGGPISKLEVYYAFRMNDEGKALAEKFSQAIREMKNDGSFDRILAPAK